MRNDTLGIILNEVSYMNKKGQGLSITTIIVAILAIVVLVVLIAVFTGRIAIFQGSLGEAGKCTGTPFTCDAHSANENVCQIAGCTFEDGVCSGTAKLCEGFTGKDNCEIVGCAWQE